MIELAELAGSGVELPTGVIVSSAVIERVSMIPSTSSGQVRSTGSGRAHSTSAGQAMYEWHLTDVRRMKRFRRPKGHPQPMWFRN